MIFGGVHMTVFFFFFFLICRDGMGSLLQGIRDLACVYEQQDSVWCAVTRGCIPVERSDQRDHD